MKTIFILKYDKQNKTLYASSKVPVLIQNKKLQYEIAFDSTDFELIYRYVDADNSIFNLQSAVYRGTPFFKDLKESTKKKIFKNRESAYNGSVRHFMLALYNSAFKKEGYVFGKRGFKVDPYVFLTIYDTDTYGYKTIILKERLGVFYNSDKDSFLETNVTQFNVDKYGNYMPIIGVVFGSYIGNQRVGDMLPSDYGLTMNK
jgi:hypothetical protein